MDKEMQRALREDQAKLEALTGEEHPLAFADEDDICPDCGLPYPATNPYCFCKPGMLDFMVDRNGGRVYRAIDLPDPKVAAIVKSLQTWADARGFVTREADKLKWPEGFAVLADAEAGLLAALAEHRA